ncbi:MAG: TolB family protein [Armatimonadota bacterium]
MSTIVVTSDINNATLWRITVMGHRARIWVCFAWLLIVALPGLTQGATGRIAFQRNGLHSNIPSNIVVMFTNGQAVTELPQHDSVPPGRVTPAISPDGKMLAFSTKVGGDFKLFTWALDDNNNVTGDPKQITLDPDCADKFPAWSPDGSQLAYLSVSKENQITLRIINADGSGMRSLPEVHFQATPSWRPDGQALLCIDKVEGRLLIKTMLVTGGYGLEIPLPASNIVAACYSPDGERIAALARGKKLTELWIIRPPGTTKTQIRGDIVAGNSICWPAPDTILFNAVKVGTTAGKSFWSVSPAGKNLQGFTGYADPKQVAFFSAQTNNGLAPLPVVVNPDAGPGPDITAPTPKERVPTGPITIVRPFEGIPVHGTVTVKVIAQPEVASIVLSIGPQFVYASAPQKGDKGAPAYMLFAWNTQQFIDFDPTGDRGLPDSYQRLLTYPDGEYTLTATALNDKRKLIGKDTLQVNVQNSLDETTLPANLLLKYEYKGEGETEGLDELYSVHGEGSLFGVGPGEVTSLASTLDARIRRSLVEVKPNGAAVLRTYVFDPIGRYYPMAFGLKESTIPETEVTQGAKYLLESNGNMTMMQQRMTDLYLPLSQIALPLPSTQATLNTQWDGNVWVVSDLMEREATLVSASNSIDGLEWIGNRPTVRIRSELYFTDLAAKLQNGIYLAISPTTSMPSLRGAKGALLAAAAASTTNPFGVAVPGGGPDRGFTPGGTGQQNAPQVIQTSNTVGYRYSWFDYERKQLLRVEDFFLYTFPLANIPVVSSTTTPGAPGMPAPGVPPPGVVTPPPPPPPAPGDGFAPVVPADPPTPGMTTPSPQDRTGDGWYLIRFTYLLSAESGK